MPKNHTTIDKQELDNHEKKQEVAGATTPPSNNFNMNDKLTTYISSLTDDEEVAPNIITSIKNFITTLTPDQQSPAYKELIKKLLTFRSLLLIGHAIDIAKYQLRDPASITDSLIIYFTRVQESLVANSHYLTYFLPLFKTTLDNYSHNEKIITVCNQVLCDLAKVFVMRILYPSKPTTNNLAKEKQLAEEKQLIELLKSVLIYPKINTDVRACLVFIYKQKVIHTIRNYIEIKGPRKEFSTLIDTIEDDKQVSTLDQLSKTIYRYTEIFYSKIINSNIALKNKLNDIRVNEVDPLIILQTTLPPTTPGYREKHHPEPDSAPRGEIKYAEPDAAPQGERKYVKPNAAPQLVRLSTLKRTPPSPPLPEASAPEFPIEERLAQLAKKMCIPFAEVELVFKIPKRYRDPLTSRLIIDPIIAADGELYDRSTIMRIHRKSPWGSLYSGRTFTDRTITDAKAVEQEIITFIDEKIRAIKTCMTPTATIPRTLPPSDDRISMQAITTGAWMVVSSTSNGTTAAKQTPVVLPSAPSFSLLYS